MKAHSDDPFDMPITGAFNLEAHHEEHHEKETRWLKKHKTVLVELQSANARIAELEGALRSIVDYEDECIAEGVPCRLSNGEYDRARAALRGGKEAGE